MELLDIVDENNNLIGIKEDKEIVHQKGLWHREAAIWIMNENGEMLLQKRSATKKQNPNKWALTAGHVDAGEEPIDTMIREIHEELGVAIEKKNIEKIVSDKEKSFSPESNTINARFTEHYFTIVPYILTDYKIELSELSELRYFSIEEIEKIIENKDENYVFSTKKYMQKVLPYIKERREKLCVKK